MVYIKALRFYYLRYSYRFTNGLERSKGELWTSEVHPPREVKVFCQRDEGIPSCTLSSFLGPNVLEGLLCSLLANARRAPWRQIGTPHLYYYKEKSAFR